MKMPDLVPLVSFYITATSCCISLMCGICLIYFTIRRKLQLEECQFMFLFLTIADMITAGGNLFGVCQQIIFLENDTSNQTNITKCDSTPACTIQSFLTTWSSMVTFLWTITIEVYCSTVIWKNNNSFTLAVWIKAILTFICWCFPLSITITALLLGVLGPDDSRTSGGWCWIISCESISVKSRILWMLLTGKLWEIISYLTIANLIFVKIFKTYICYRQRHLTIFGEEEDICTNDDYFPTVSISNVNRNGSSSSIENSIMFRENYKRKKMLFWIPACLILARIWGTIRFGFNIYDITTNSLPSFIDSIDQVLMFFQGIGDSSQATCNFILVLIFMREAFPSCQCPYTRSDEDESLIQSGG